MSTLPITVHTFHSFSNKKKMTITSITYNIILGESSRLAEPFLSAQRPSISAAK